MTKETKVDEAGKYRQLLVALLANLSTFSFGIITSWPSSMVPRIQSEDPPVGSEPMTEETASWLTGIMCLVASVTSALIGTIVNKFGRKLALWLMGLPLCGCWLFTIFATEQWVLFVARTFAGICAGMSLFLVPIYVSEIASDGIRGMLGSLLLFALNAGILLGYILGALLSYRTFAIIGSVFPLLYIVLFFFSPESPVYLVRRNRLNDAARSLTLLRGGHKSVVERELLNLQAEAKRQTASGEKIKFSDLFRDRATIKGLGITLGLFAGQQFAGISAVLSYTSSIFSMSGSSLSPDSSAIIVGLIQLCGSFLSTTLMERAGRKPLLLTSCSIMFICHYVLGGFCYLQVLRYDVSGFSWISIVALSVYMIAYGLGLGPGPYVVSSEILSRDISSLVLTIGMSFVWMLAFLVVKLFPNLIDWFGMHGCFFLLGTSCAVTFVFVYLIIPETKGQPRQAILDRLNGLPEALNKKFYGTSSNDVFGKNAPSPEAV